MPSHEEHCQQSLKKYGKTFSELHTWMDEPCKVLAGSHRIYRHDPVNSPKEAKKLFGELADHACLDHIILDMEKARLNGKDLPEDGFSDKIKNIGEVNKFLREYYARKG